MLPSPFQSARTSFFLSCGRRRLLDILARGCLGSRIFKLKRLTVTIVAGGSEREPEATADAERNAQRKFSSDGACFIDTGDLESLER